MDRRGLLGHTGLFFTTLCRVPLRTQNVWKTMSVLLEQKRFFVCPLINIWDVDRTRPQHSWPATQCRPDCHWRCLSELKLFYRILKILTC